MANIYIYSSCHFLHRNYICLLQKRVITVDQDLISLPCSESNIIQSLTAGTLDLHQCHCDQTASLPVSKNRLKMPKASFPQYKNWLRVCSTLLETSHHLVTFISITINSAKFITSCSIRCSRGHSGTKHYNEHSHCLQNILGHCSAQLLTESAHKDPGKAGERGRAHITSTCLVLFRKWPLLS